MLSHTTCPAHPPMRAHGHTLRNTRPVWGHVWRCTAVALGAALSVGAAHAQFQKTPWPLRVPTPVIDAVDLAGQRWGTQQLQGRAVVLNFWATWCAPCKQELPSLQTLHAWDADAVQVLSVNVREPLGTVRRFVRSSALDLPVIWDASGDMARQWGVNVFPTTVLIAPDGKARWRVVGEVDWAGKDAGQWLAALGK